jgi:hypothetical protein
VAGGLLTHLYELNMAAIYLRRPATGQAMFSLFVRAPPGDRGVLPGWDERSRITFRRRSCMWRLPSRFLRTAEHVPYPVR